MSYDDQERVLTNLTEKGMIRESEKNLRSKIESILLSLEALEKKESRLTSERRKQLKSLARKREELQRVSKRTTARVKTASYEQKAEWTQTPGSLSDLRRLDSKLLQESSDILNQY